LIKLLIMRKFSDYHFDGQKNGEKIILVSHRHWFNIAIQFIYIVGILLFLILIYSAFGIFFPEAERNTVLILNLALISFLMLLWLFVCVTWIDYYLDVWIITDRRVVNVEQKGLFSREVSELEHIRVQDVTTEVKGFFATFFNYGDVHVQTAAETSRFIFRSVSNPYAIKNLIMQLQKVQKREEADELGEVIQKKIAS